MTDVKRFYWRLRAFLWGFCHPFATEEENHNRAVKAAREELEARNE
jgi:hypothetical protein